MSEEKKRRLKEYQKNYCEAKNSQYNNEENNFLIVIFNSFFNYDLIVYAIYLVVHY